VRERGAFSGVRADRRERKNASLEEGEVDSRFLENWIHVFFGLKKPGPPPERSCWWRRLGRGCVNTSESQRTRCVQWCAGRQTRVQECQQKEEEGEKWIHVFLT
jgi:hypothetical protein